MALGETAGPVVKVHVALTWAEYRRAFNRIRTKRQMNSVLTHTGGLLMLGIFLGYMLKDRHAKDSSLCWILFGWIALTWVLSVVTKIRGMWVLRRWWKDVADLLEPATYTFSPAGVSTTNPSAT